MLIDFRRNFVLIKKQKSKVAKLACRMRQSILTQLSLSCHKNRSRRIVQHNLPELLNSNASSDKLRKHFLVIDGTSCPEIYLDGASNSRKIEDKCNLCERR